MKDLHVFIDTNIWLSFYAYNKDDLEELRKLIALLKKGKLTLYANTQLRDEFYRNRERKLAESIRDFSKTNIPKGLPRYMNEYGEAASFRDALKEAEIQRDALIARAKADAQSKSLVADKLFADILEVVQVGQIPQSTVSKALDRRIRGNPPGKSNSLGDQIHWEYLLTQVPEGVDLHIVSKDGDFESSLNEGQIEQFLADEWQEKKSGGLKLHTELRPFLAEHFPNIKLAIDVEKLDAVENLVNSGSFASTHSAIERLGLIADSLSWQDAERIFNAGITNSQINWIGSDGDVRNFYQSLIKKYGHKLEDSTQSLLVKYFSEISLDDLDQDIPF